MAAGYRRPNAVPRRNYYIAATFTLLALLLFPRSAISFLSVLTASLVLRVRVLRVQHRNRSAWIVATRFDDSARLLARVRGSLDLGQELIYGFTEGSRAHNLGKYLPASYWCAGALDWWYNVRYTVITADDEGAGLLSADVCVVLCVYWCTARHEGDARRRGLTYALSFIPTLIFTRRAHLPSSAHPRTSRRPCKCTERPRN